MELAFITYFNGEFINTYDGKIMDINDVNITRYQRKASIKVLPYIIEDNIFYKYSIINIDNKTIKLIIYKGSYNFDINWQEIYSISASFNILGVVEKGNCDLAFWQEFFATCYCNEKYDEKNIPLFSLTKNPMKIIREVFSTHIEENPFLFFKNYQRLKKITDRKFDVEIFKNIPLPKINKNVGKMYNNTKLDVEIRYYGWQREIEIGEDIFFDITVLYGYVNNGVIDICEKHRFFITKDFAFSPDGGDLEVLISQNFYCNIHDTKMKRKYPDLMLEKYTGKYYFQYFFSKYYIPAFEILAKAGITNYADNLLDSYYDFKFSDSNIKVALNVNIYGKNDKEIFGFKLNKFNAISFDLKMKYSKCYCFNDFIRNLKKIQDIAPAVFSYKIDENLFEFLKHRVGSKTILKEIEYLLKIGTSNYSFYIDYLRMCNELNRYSGGMYPLNLRYEHDVMVSYLNQLKEAKNNQEFKEVVSSKYYQDKLFESEEYCILAPREANDLVNESYQLSHCVRSYIKNVALGQCQIFFMREKLSKSKPFITIEVRNDKVTQARGKYNRTVSNKEYVFLDKWATEKNIILDFVY